MARTNLVITTYAGEYERKFHSVFAEDRKRFLRYNLQMLNMLENQLSQITIMKPAINPNHREIPGYYDFTKLNIDNIRSKIVIMECPNEGISYGQFWRACDAFPDFDYYIFIEDDYVPFQNNFDRIMITEYEKCNANAFLCSGIRKANGEYSLYNWYGTHLLVPDFALGIIHKNAVRMIWNHYKSLDCILNEHRSLGNIHPMDIYKHQVIMAKILMHSGVHVKELNDFLSLFYESTNQCLYILNTDNVALVDPRSNNNVPTQYQNPLFVPLDLFEPNDYNAHCAHICQYLKDPHMFLFNLSKFTYIKARLYNTLLH